MSGLQVTTMELLASETTVPVPEVLIWCSDATIPVGAEYLIMQKVRLNYRYAFATGMLI